MAKLIVKSPYIKCTGSGNVAGGYLHYIGTREHVQKLTDNRPPTRKQEQLIAKLMKDFPAVKELDEYSDYSEHKTKANASALITMALEENWSAVSQMDGYMKYIATRPRVERLGSTACSATRTASIWKKRWRNSIPIPERLDAHHLPVPGRRCPSGL